MGAGLRRGDVIVSVNRRDVAMVDEPRKAVSRARGPLLLNVRRGENAFFVVGVLLLATVEDMLLQADEPGTPRWISTLAFTGGFAVFVVLAEYLG
jgi:hypothetical protein